MSSTFEREQAGGGGFGRGSDGEDGRRDRKRLQAFVAQLEDRLSSLILDPDQLSEDLLLMALSAWNVGPQRDARLLIEALERPDWDEALIVHGLMGSQLEFKLAVVERAIVLDQIVATAPARVAAGGTPERAADAAAEEYLKCADIVLESLSSALGGAGAVLIEFKKMIEWIKGVAARFGIRF